jgi:uncharacterized damage-inducible protein DinB
MSSSEIQELQQDLRSGRDAILAAVEGVSEAEAHQIPEPGEWTVVQLVAHVTELQPFWVSKAVLITQVDDPQITRTAVENDERLAAVTDHSQDGLASLIRQMNAANDQVVDIVGGYRPIKIGPARPSGGQPHDRCRCHTVYGPPRAAPRRSDNRVA